VLNDRKEELSEDLCLNTVTVDGVCLSVCSGQCMSLRLSDFE